MKEFLVTDAEFGGASNDKKQTYSILTVGFKIGTFDPKKCTFIEKASLSFAIKHDAYVVSAEGMKVNGLTLEFLDKTGVTMDNAKAMIHNFLTTNIKSGMVTPLGHGVKGDILEYVLQKLVPGIWFGKVYSSYEDTLCLAESLQTQGIIPSDVKLNLEDLCSYFGKTDFDFHTCEGDVDATIFCYCEMQNLLQKLRLLLEKEKSVSAS